MYIYLVRHGQSEGNVRKTFHGQADYPLTELGRELARQAAAKLREVSFTRCCASDMRRAWDTAEICLEGRNITPEECPGLREQDVGELEGMTWEDMKQKFPDILQPYVEDWFHTTPPGGESPEEMMDRVSSCVNDIILQGEDTLVVAHNGSLTLILDRLGLVSREQLLTPGWFFEQGTYSAIRIRDEGAELVCFNR